MKLVELLARELSEWPVDAGVAMQDPDRDNTVWCLPSDNGKIEFNGHEWKCPNQDFDVLVNKPNRLSVDYKTSIVTCAQWQAERDKQKGGEWKRHRGGSMPKHVSPTDMVECKRRDGEVTAIDKASAFTWPHKHCRAAPYRQIMSYRVISQPQAEEVEVTKPELTYTLDWVEVDDTKPVANPIAWRDTIIHCQAIIEDCEREIQANVNLLDSEGLFMQLEPKKGMQSYDVPAVDMGDWRNWKAGDVVECIESSCDNVYTVGNYYKVEEVTKEYAKVADDCGPESYCHISDTEDVRFMLSR